VSSPTQQAGASPSRSSETGASDVTLSVFLVLLLATTLMAGPLREVGAAWLLTALRLLALVAGVAAVVPERGFAVAAAIAALGAACAHVVSDERGPVLLGARVVFFAVVAAALLVRVFRPGRVSVHRLLGAVAVYVLLAVAWGTAYQLVVALRPDAIRGASGLPSLDEAMWLSFITITTTGYGDVLPVAALPRSLAALEAMVGVLYPAILISRLVSLVQPAGGAGAGDGR
jgi:Ion channel